VLFLANSCVVLVIPFILIWQIRVRWTQKIALVCTLCLTIVMIAITIARAAGVKWEGRLDSVWETYFIVIAAEIGLTLVAISAFRALYVSNVKSRRVQNTITNFSWYEKGRNALLHAASKITRKTYTNNTSTDKSDDGFIKNNIPRATLTGTRTLIVENGRSSSTSGSIKDDV
jgi:hypothetical protein